MGFFSDIWEKDKEILSMGATGADKAAKAQRKATANFTKQMNVLQEEFQLFSDTTVESFQQLSDSFDPYDLQNEYDSLYEAVIQPMETDFRENVLPSLRSGYSGGALGSDMFTGGREFTEAQARSDLSMNKALLRFNARETGIQRNFMDYDRRRGDLGLQYDIGVAPIQSAMNIERDIYGAKGDEIAADSAASQAWGNLLPKYAGAMGSIIPTSSGTSGTTTNTQIGATSRVTSGAGPNFNNFLGSKGYLPGQLPQYGNQPTKFSL